MDNTIIIEAAKIGPILASIHPLIGAALIGGAFSILGKLFGGGSSSSSNKTATTTQTTTSTPTGYQSPVLGLMDLNVGNMLGQNMIRSANWGWPEGKGLDTSFAKSVVSLLGGEGQKLLDLHARGGAGNRASGFFSPYPGTQMGRTTAEACKNNCWNTYKNTPDSSASDYEACVAKCSQTA